QPRCRVCCAPGHFGVNPFYYVHVEHPFVFCNTLNSLRRHPAVTDRLYDPAVADFLLFERNEQLHRTTFADIWKLPPAHTLIISPGLKKTPRRYWSLPLDTRIKYRRPQDYVDHFREVFTAAVTER